MKLGTDAPRILTAAPHAHGLTTANLAQAAHLLITGNPLPVCWPHVTLPTAGAVRVASKRDHCPMWKRESTTSSAGPRPTGSTPPTTKAKRSGPRWPTPGHQHVRPGTGGLLGVGVAGGIVPSLSGLVACSERSRWAARGSASFSFPPALTDPCWTMSLVWQGHRIGGDALSLGRPPWRPL
jgi:hypothetical protein